jgi:SGNH domain (fused to AT3 domains)
LDPFLQTLMALLLSFAALVGQGTSVAIRASGPGSVSIERALPSGLTPSLGDAVDDVPASYLDGCHGKPGQTKAKVCTYGDKTASVKVLLFGDSHAAAWLPALDTIGKRQHWRILSLTKSACPLPMTKVAVRGDVAPDCATWRTNALAAIKAIHPALVVGNSFDHVYTIPGKSGSAFQPAWQAGMTKTLTALKSRAKHVVLLGDSPLWTQEAPACLRQHRSNIGACATKRSVAVFPGKIASARQSATDAGVPFADSTPLMCLADPCPVVSGKFLLLRDDSHMTATWSRQLAAQLRALLPDPTK